MSPIDRFLRDPDVRERHEITVRAPAALVLDVARHFDPQSIPLASAIFRIRAVVMGAREDRGDLPKGLVPWTLAMGWGVLAEEPDRFFVAGATCQPWKADVVFTPAAPDRYASEEEPDTVKIVWSLEAEPLDGTSSRFATETRVRATDAGARRKFRSYWRLARFGILAIRLLLLPGIRREAERRFRAA